MKKLIISLMILVFLPMVMALSQGECYKYEPVKLMTGWNGIGIVTNYSDLTIRNINYSLANDSSGAWNFLGFSAMRKCKPITSLNFYDSSGNKKSYNDAVSSNWIDELEFISSTLTAGGQKTYNKICPYEAYWLKSYLAVNISYESVYGESLGNIYNWNKLRFANSSGSELNITDAETDGWIEKELQYWGETGLPPTYQFIPLSSGSLNAWQGYFIYSYKDNIYLLTNNETKRCSVRPRIHGKFTGNGRFRPIIKAKYTGSKIFRWRIYLNHMMRLLGNRRSTIG